MSEFPKIETLYERDETTRKVKVGVLKNRTYDMIKTWEWTEKVDGTNIRCIWDHEKKVVSFAGRTDNAAIHGDLIRNLYETVRPEKLAEVFPDVSAVLYGEGYGAGIQKAGVGYGPTKKFIMFDAKVGGQWWVNIDSSRDIADKLGLEHVPYIGTYTLEQATLFVQAGMKSRIADIESEGMVGRTIEPLFDKRGHRLIVKLKTRDF